MRETPGDGFNHNQDGLDKGTIDRLRYEKSERRQTDAYREKETRLSRPKEPGPVFGRRGRFPIGKRRTEKERKPLLGIRGARDRKQNGCREHSKGGKKGSGRGAISRRKTNVWRMKGGSTRTSKGKGDSLRGGFRFQDRRLSRSAGTFLHRTKEGKKQRKRGLDFDRKRKRSILYSQKGPLPLRKSWKGRRDKTRRRENPQREFFMNRNASQCCFVAGHPRGKGRELGNTEENERKVRARFPPA